MSAVIRRFVSPERKLRRDEHASAREALTAVQRTVRPEAQLCIDRAIVELDRQLASSEKEPFTMVYREFSLVSEWLAENSSRKLTALRLWALILGYVDGRTGEIALSRDEIAEALKVSPADVSRVCSELVECQALSRRLVPMPGMRGRGAVRYALNPLVGSRLPSAQRQEARASADVLKLAPLPTERRSRAPVSVVPVV